MFRIISIHALREEGDAVRIACARFCCKFQSTPSARRATNNPVQQRFNIIISIHALREEGDGIRLGGSARFGLFQSTPSARRATS